MADPSLFDAFRIPSDTLIALDNRTFHFAVQPFHYLLRMTHIVSAAAFFGGIVLFDLRLAGLRSHVKLKAFAADALPWLYVTFGLAMLSGILLFLYDPVHMGSRAYFVPKMILIILGLANALVYHRFAFRFALGEPPAAPRSARWAGALSLAFWVGVMVFSSMNAEGVPKLLLR
jgi:phosphoglycerol transferase MdoB-like AlkP superfamily enzyme